MMGDFFYLIPLALVIGLVALGSFLWALKSAQYEDLDGAAIGRAFAVIAVAGIVMIALNVRLIRTYD